MPTNEDFTIGEIGRAVLDLKTDFTNWRLEQAKTYVRQDVWQQSEIAAGVRVGEIQKDISEVHSKIDKVIATRDADRRLIWTALLGPIITGIIVGVVLLGLQVQ